MLRLTEPRPFLNQDTTHTIQSDWRADFPKISAGRTCGLPKFQDARRSDAILTIPAAAGHLQTPKG